MPSVLAWIISSSMIFLAILVWGLFVFYARRSSLPETMRNRFAVVSVLYLSGWLGLAFILGYGGAFQAAPSSTFPFIVIGIAVPILIGGSVLRQSATLNSVINTIPLSWLVGIQLYRIFGVIFLALYALGTLPAEFALPAGLGDFAVGITAPLVAYLLYQGSRGSGFIGLIWSLAGILDLVIAVALGFLSAPGPFHTLALEYPNTLITAFPLVLVPVFAVPLSMLLHWAVLKRLRVEKMDSSRCLGSQPVWP